MSKRHCYVTFNASVLARDGRLYMWTFTRIKQDAFLVMRAEWNKLLTYLRRRLPDWCGLRVYEVHPGRCGYSHGLHVHVLTNRFFDVRLVRAVCKSAGWGRVHVLRIAGERAGYVAKYLGKKRPEALKGWRMVATFGAFDRTRFADIVVHTLRASLFRRAALAGFFRDLSFGERCTLISRWEWAHVAGLPLPIPYVRSSSHRWRRVKGCTDWDTPSRIAGTREDFEARRRARRPARLIQPHLPWGFTPRLSQYRPLVEDYDYTLADRSREKASRLHTERLNLMEVNAPF